ncbi:MAG: DNA-3-methyladenine glycosylase 2 family protein [Actinobacteria bacterium]|nr:DNA-3-methyladenine glycosylase 2 family protein [Actinomycetota bacterium]NCW96629.1 DNA-3-methyladenine glycosylase 2 family protein [Actinomycetota bacterium]NCX75746.1 DNA-3-methyladenine glycosylase 2 family protein [Actinomycetota bacterium]
MGTTTENSQAIARRIVRIEPKFREVVTKFGPAPIGARPSKISNFQALAESILGQQLSVKAAATITERVIQAAGGRMDPAGIAKLTPSRLRSAGCSAAKARAISELAQVVADGDLPIRSLNKKSDEAIMELLLPLYGVGRWTVEMFLIFQLGRSDVWPTGDLGVRRGWEKLYKMKREVEIDELEKLGAKFAPHRSHLAWYCWRAHSLY